jgi:hypothetical protein
MEAGMDQFRMQMQEKINVYLNSLRKSGAVNMFGAAPYISETFGVNKEEARQYLKNWMESFSKKEDVL